MSYEQTTMITLGETKFFTEFNLMLEYTTMLIKRGDSFIVHCETNGWTVEI